jgi:hypothetical protein
LKSIIIQLPSYSEDVAALRVDVASVVKRCCVHHGPIIGDTLPNARRNVLTVLHGIFLHLLDVGLLRRAIARTNALVMASVKRISLLEWSKHRLLFLFSFLLGESNIGAICREARVEAATLTDSVGPRLLTMKDL